MFLPAYKVVPGRPLVTVPSRPFGKSAQKFRETIEFCKLAASCSTWAVQARLLQRSGK